METPDYRETGREIRIFHRGSNPKNPWVRMGYNVFDRGKRWSCFGGGVAGVLS